MMFDVLTNELLEDFKDNYEMKQEALAWIERMTRFSVQGGKMNRGLATLAVFKTLAQARGQRLSPRELCRAAALGWCVEWLQAFFLVADDLMDGSETRRGQPCWYKLPEVRFRRVSSCHGRIIVLL